MMKSRGQLAGTTRLDLPLLLGTIVTEDPDEARVAGFFVHFADILLNLHPQGIPGCARSTLRCCSPLLVIAGLTFVADSKRRCEPDVNALGVKIASIVGLA